MEEKIPYIDKTQRTYLDDKLKPLLELPPLNIGSVNYTITKFILSQLPLHAKYTDYNAMIGVLECIKLELYRKRIQSYEDKKCIENGEVY